MPPVCRKYYSSSCCISNFNGQWVIYIPMHHHESMAYTPSPSSDLVMLLTGWLCSCPVLQAWIFLYRIFQRVALIYVPTTQHSLPYTWAVIVPALANLVWGINVWASVPARPEQVCVFCFHFETANRRMIILTYYSDERAHTLMISLAGRLERLWKAVTPLLWRLKFQTIEIYPLLYHLLMYVPYFLRICLFLLLWCNMLSCHYHYQRHSRSLQLFHML